MFLIPIPRVGRQCQKATKEGPSKPNWTTLPISTSNSLLCLYKMRSQQFCNGEAVKGVHIKEFFQLVVA